MAAERSKPVAVVDNPEADEEIRRQEELKELYRRAAERMSERNRDLDPEAELAFITDVVEEVRQERYDREQAQATNGC